MQELYQAALAEGGKLIVYAGGDSPAQQTGAKTSFEARFPGMSVEMIVDLSKVQKINEFIYHFFTISFLKNEFVNLEGSRRPCGQSTCNRKSDS